MTKVLTSFLLLCLAASLVAWAVLLLHERGLYPLRDAVKFVRRLSWGGRLAVLPLFFALFVFGRQQDPEGGENQSAPYSQLAAAAFLPANGT